VSGEQQGRTCVSVLDCRSCLGEEEQLVDHVPYIVEEECIACGSCEEVCPEVFKLNESLGFAQVINPGGAPEDRVQEAIDICPVTCIHWADDR